LNLAASNNIKLQDKSIASSWEKLKLQGAVIQPGISGSFAKLYDFPEDSVIMSNDLKTFDPSQFAIVPKDVLKGLENKTQDKTVPQ